MASTKVKRGRKVSDPKPASKVPGKRGRTAGKKAKKPTYSSYGVYIYRVLKQVHPQTGISSKG